MAQLFDGWYYKKYCFGLIKIMHHGFKPQWWLGYCWTIWEKPAIVYAPIPFNWVLGFLRLSYKHIVWAVPLDKWGQWLRNKGAVRG